jgi:AmmeMemoRadiSam system protein A
VRGRRERLHPLADLARRAVEALVAEGRYLAPEPLPAGLPARAGVFVTIREHAALRGCVGSIEPTTSSLAAEVIRSATLAATDDPRFRPIGPAELADLDYEVSVLGEPERVGRAADLDPRFFGVIVRAGRRRGLLLPGIPGLDTGEQQVQIARQKAGIGSQEPIEVFRFRTRHFE